MITGGGADCHSKRSSSDEDFVIGVDRLLVAGGLWGAPADRNDAGLALRVMHGCADRVDKALVCIRGEIDNEVGFGGNSACHLNVQHHLAIGVVTRTAFPM